MLSAPVGERRSTVGGCPWRPGLWRWLVQHRGRNFSFRLKARAFWANNFHPLCRSATPTTAQTLPIDMLCDPPRRSIVEAQQPISLHPLVSNRGESCSSPARCVPCRFPATTTRNSRTGRHGQDWPCNLYVAMPGIGLTTTRIQRHCRAKWRDFMPFQNQGSIRDASDLSISRGHDIGQCGDRMPNRQTPITLRLDLAIRRPDLWAASYKVRLLITPHISGVAGYDSKRLLVSVVSPSSATHQC